MHANKRNEISTVYAGDIAAAVGFKNTTTGDTICDEKNFVILEKMEFPVRHSNAASAHSPTHRAVRFLLVFDLSLLS